MSAKTRFLNTRELYQGEDDKTDDDVNGATTREELVYIDAMTGDVLVPKRMDGRARKSARARQNGLAPTDH